MNTYLNIRQYSWRDRCLIQLDQAIRTVLAPTHSNRPNPANPVQKTDLSLAERKNSARLMRVNHSGEISAQALYHAQALTAGSPQIRHAMQQAAQEENDHLAWCQERLRELNARVSVLNPLWYTGSFIIGLLAGLAGDRWNLGFLAETERQVVKHLDTHLVKITPNDHRSRAILQQMREDESYHATTAVTAGAAELPQAVRLVMRFCSLIMTLTAAKI